MKAKYIQIGFIVIALAGLIYLIVQPTNGGTGNRKKAPGVDSTKVSNARAVASREQIELLKVLHPTLVTWNQTHKVRASRLTANPIYINNNAKIEDYLRPTPSIDHWFSRGDIIHLLEDYLERMNQLRFPNAADRQILQQLISFWNDLKMEPDPVTVTIVNRSSRTLSFRDGNINPGGRSAYTVESRKLGLVSSYEGALGLDGKAFPFNMELPGASYDEANYTWTQTGKSAYTLEVRN